MHKGHRRQKTGHCILHVLKHPHGTVPQMTEICHTRMKQLHTCTADPSCVDNSQGRSRLVHDAPPSHGCQRELSRGFDASRSLGAPPRAWGTHATLRVPYGGHGATGPERAGGSMEGRTHGEGVGLAGCPSGPTPQGGMAPRGRARRAPRGMTPCWFWARCRCCFRRRRLLLRQSSRPANERRS